MSIVERIQGNDNLDGVITFKINSEDKEDLIEFCKDRKISMGKLIREAIEMIVEEILAEEKRK